MQLPFKNTFSSLAERVSNSSWINKRRKNALWSLNSTQFFGVINDNLYKLLMVFLLIDTLGKTKATLILAAAGTIYVIPFLLFSSSAGILADRFSKQKLMILLKGAEVVIMLLAIVAFAYKSLIGCYTLLFFLAAHSAMFGPSKYGIIPELVPKELVSKANGLITSFTYVAIILGTFLASFLTEATHRKFVLTACVCLIVAILGFLSSLCISKTQPQGSEKKINPFFVREIYHTLKFCAGIKYLAPSIFGSAYFLFIGAFAQLNIIPFAMQSLGLSEVAGGYLFLVIALGIAGGSMLCGKWAKKKLELGISCLAGFFLSLIFILLALFSFSLTMSVILLILLGLAGGIFVIPFDTFIQINSPVEKRGQVIASANFLSFTGVLVASIALYVFNDLLYLPPSWSFALIGLITACVTFVLALRLSGTVFPFLSRKVFFKLSKARLTEGEPITDAPCLYILENATIFKAILLVSSVPNIHFLLPKRKNKPFWYNWIHSMDEMELQDTQEALIYKAKESLKIHRHTCLLLKESLSSSPGKASMFSNFFSREKVCLVKIEKDESGYNLIKVSKLT